MTIKTSRRKFSVLASVLTLLGAVFITTPVAVQADFTPFTLVSPTNNQKVSLGASNNWYLPIRVQGAAPGSDSNRFTAYFYDSVGDIAATVTWYIAPRDRIDTRVDWTFKLGLSNLRYVENPIASNIYVPSDAKYSAELTATKAPFKNGTLKPGTYSFQLFVTNNSNSDAQRIDLGDVSGLTVGTPAGVKCAPGSYSKTGTWTLRNTCTATSPGHVASAVGSKNQTATPAGSYSPKSGAAYSSKCQEGTYQAAVGKSACTRASLGYHVPLRGSKKQVKCPVGKYSDRTGTFACTLAEPGTYVSAEGATRSTQCPVGRYQPNAAKGFCTPAPAGSFVAFRGAIGALPCGPGFYQDQTGATSCKKATLGHFVPGIAPDGIGGTYQSPCSRGTYADTEGASECVNAPIGYYVPSDGASSKTQCPVGTSNSAPGSYRAEECLPVT